MATLCNFGQCININYSDVLPNTWNLDLEDLEKDSGRILQTKRKQAGEKGSTKHVFEVGMVLYSKLRPYLNKVAVANEDGVCTSEILPLKFTGLTSVYAQIALMSPLFLDYAKEHSYGVKMPRLGMTDGANFLMPVPPLAEQYRIVERVSELMPLVEGYGALEASRERLDAELPGRLRKSIMQQAVQGRLVAQDPSDEPASALLKRIREERTKLIAEKKLKAPKGGESVIYRASDGGYYEKRGKKIERLKVPFELPEGWAWTRMSTLVDLLSGVDLAPSQYNDKHEGIPYLTGASNFNDGRLIENRWTNQPKRIANYGDLLFTCKGTVGAMAISAFDHAHIARQIMAVRPIDNMTLGYIKLFLMSMVEGIKSQAKGVIPGIERSTILDALIPLPSIDEQARIILSASSLLDMLG